MKPDPRLLLVIAAVAGGCAVDVPPLGDYTNWQRAVVRGPAPGHGDTIRWIYANDEALVLDEGRWAEGAIVVKEIYTRDGDDKGALRYVAIMRRCAAPEDIDPYADGGCGAAGYDWAQSGWLFTKSDEPQGNETHAGFCWDNCHRAAPYEGAFLDYSRW